MPKSAILWKLSKYKVACLQQWVEGTILTNWNTHLKIWSINMNINNRSSESLKGQSSLNYWQKLIQKD